MVLCLIESMQGKDSCDDDAEEKDDVFHGSSSKKINMVLPPSPPLPLPSPLSESDIIVSELSSMYSVLQPLAKEIR